MGRVGVPGCTSPHSAGGTGLREQAGVTEAGGDLAIPHQVPTDRWGWPGAERTGEVPCHQSAWCPRMSECQPTVSTGSEAGRDGLVEAPGCCHQVTSGSGPPE